MPEINWELYSEAYKRGILPAEKKTLYEEAVNRGIVPDRPEGHPTSTVTGLPVPTGEEAFEGSKKAIKTFLPIAGDIAMTALAPQIGVPAKLSTLGKFGIQAANMLFRGAGSAAGAGGGSMAADVLTGDQVDTQRAQKEALIGLASEAGLSVAGKPIKWGIGKLKDPVMELVSDITFLGSAMKGRLRNKMIDQTTDRANKFVADLAPDIVKNQNVGISDLRVMVKSALEENRVMYDLYEDVLSKQAAKTGGKIELPATHGLFDKVRTQAWEEMSTGGKAPSRLSLNARIRNIFGFAKQSDFSDILEVFKPLGGKEAGIKVTPKQIQGLLATVYKKGKKGFHDLPSESMKVLREDLKSALLKDLDAIAGQGGQKTVLQAKKTADETFKAIKQFDFINRLFEKSISEVPGTGAQQLQPVKLAKLIYSSKGKIQREMPDLWPKLKKEADFYMEIGPQFGKQASQMISGSGSVISRGLGGAIGGFLGGAPGVATAEGLGIVSAYTLLTPKAQKIISGIVSQSTKGAGKAGLHLGGQELSF